MAQERKHPKPEPSALATRIRSARLAAGFDNSAAFARLCDVEPVTFWRYETENMEPGARVLEKIAEHAQVSTRWLLHGDEAGKPGAAA